MGRVGMVGVGFVPVEESWAAKQKCPGNDPEKSKTPWVTIALKKSLGHICTMSYVLHTNGTHVASGTMTWLLSPVGRCDDDDSFCRYHLANSGYGRVHLFINCSSFVHCTPRRQPQPQAKERLSDLSEIMRIFGRCGGRRRISSVGTIISLSIAMWGALRIATAVAFPRTVGTTSFTRHFPLHTTESRTSSSTSSTTTSAVILFMGTRDGKQRRPKKSESSSSSRPSTTSSTPSSTTTSSSSTASTPVTPPQRVSNGINIPIRHQIRYGRLNKALREQQQQQQQSSGGGFKSSSSSSSSPSSTKTVRTKYRRKWNEEERDEAAQARRRKGQDPNWELVWNNQTSLVAAPLVIVDGYNIIYHWSRLKKHMIKGDVRICWKRWEVMTIAHHLVPSRDNSHLCMWG